MIFKIQRTPSNLIVVKDSDTHKFLHPDGQVHFEAAFYKSREQAQEVIDSAWTCRVGDILEAGGNKVMVTRMPGDHEVGFVIIEDDYGCSGTLWNGTTIKVKDFNAITKAELLNWSYLNWEKE